MSVAWSPGAFAQDLFPEGTCPTVLADRNLSCTAEDVTLASVEYTDGTLPESCIAGDPITLDIRLGFVINANAIRYDVATWIARTPGDIKLLPDNGGATECSLFTASQQYVSIPPPPGLDPAIDPIGGVLVVDDLDADACYDVTSGSQNQYFEADFQDGLTVTCLPDPDGQLTFQTLVSWDQGSAAADCDGGVDDFADGNKLSNSKCKAGEPIVLPIDVLSRLVIEKQTIPDGLLDTFDFTGTTTDPVNGQVAIPLFSLSDGQEQVLTAPLDATYVVTEAIPPGFAVDSIVCTNQTTMQPANVTVNAANGTVTVPMSGSQFDVRCVYTNDQLPATLTVVKQANGGNDTFDFEWGSTTNTPATAFQLATANNTASTDIIIDTGLGDTDFFVTETLTPAQIAAGWVAESAECAPSDDLANPIVTGTTGADGATVTGLTLNAGDDITCTFVNNAAATVTVTKTAQGGDDTFAFITNLPGGNFSLMTMGGSANTGPITVPIADSATGVPIAIAEDVSLLMGWTLADITCSGTNETVNANLVEFTAQPGNSINCTFTNVADGQITIVKDTEGGDGTFNFITDVPGATSPFSIMTTNNTGSVSIATPPPGTYIVSENVPAGWDLTDMVCVETGGTANSGPINADTIQIIVEAGETITCTFTNTQRGEIVIVKATDPAGSDVFGFTSTSGPATALPASFDVIAGGPGNSYPNLLAGTYTVTENDPTPAFDLTDITCTESIVDGDGSPGPTPTTDDEATRTATINVDPGETVTCTYTNTQRANLTITKAVTVDGPAVADFDFTSATLPDATTFSLNGVTAAVPVSTTYSNLEPGSYDVAEDELAALNNGWALVNTVCSDGSTVDNIVLDPGDDVTCTFTNAPLGSATIIKNTIGGDASFNYIGTAPFSGLVLDTTILGGTASADFTNQLDPLNNPYAIVENTPLPPGWSLTALGCDEIGGTDATGAPLNTPSTTDLGTLTAEINADYNEMITCTFENTLAGTLTIRKQTNPADVDLAFGFTSTEADLTGSIRDYDIANEELVFSALPGTTYSTTETLPEGWQITGISCTGQTASTVTYTGATTSPTNGFEPGDDTVNVDLAAGENVVCEFTNTQESSIVITKNVVGADGVFNFGSVALGNFAINTAVNDTATFQGLLPGQFMVAETPVPTGYQLTFIECLGATNSTITIGAAGGFDPGDTGVTIDLAPGENILCGFENTELGSITVEKQTLPDGSAVDFTFDGDAAGTIQDGGTIVVGNLLPGTYSSTETVPAGWDLTDITCDDVESAAPSTGDTGTGTATFNVEPGEDVTCVFTNTQRGSLTVIKNVLNDDGGNDTVADFSVASTAGALSFDGGVVNGDTTTYTATVSDLLPGDYQVSEADNPGYTEGSWSCSNDASGPFSGTDVTVGPGEDVTCSITNDDIAPTLTLTKIVNNNFNGMAGENDFGISVGGVVVTSGATNPYTANVPLAINETLLPGYEFVSLTGDEGCPASLGGTVTLDEGAVVSCTITNRDIAPDINLAKTVNGPATRLMDGTYEVVYTIVATNNSQGIGMYNLVDTFSPGAGITFNSATLMYMAGTENDQSGTIAMTLTNGGQWVTDEGLGIGLSESWIVTANFTVDPALVDPQTSQCDPGAPAINTGFYNAVSGVDAEGNIDDNDTCTGLPDPAINLAKTVNGPAALQMDGTYEVVYTITATNSGEGPGSYDLVDTFSPANGITLNTAEIAYGGGETQTGTVTTPFASGATVVSDEALAAGASETWTVTANFTVDPAVLVPAEGRCDPSNPVINTGFYNAVSGVDLEDDTTDNATCTGVPDPSINLAKTLVGPAVTEMDGTYTVEYTITATNNGDGPGVYDLVDTFALPNGVTVNTAEIAYGGGETQSGTVTSPFTSGATAVMGEALAGGGTSETWTVTANFTVDPAVLEPAAASCDPANPVANTGFYNVVSGVDQEADTSDNDTCTDIPQVLIDALAGVCINDVPYISWDISTTGLPNVTTATVRVYGDGGNGSTDPADYVNLLDTFSGVPFSGQALWPGAAVDNEGNGVDWPGWDFVNGQWVEDPTDERVPSILVEFEVNPTTSQVVQYPPRTANCVPPQDAPPPPPALPVPVDSEWALWLLTLLMLATGLYFGPRAARRR